MEPPGGLTFSDVYNAMPVFYVRMKFCNVYVTQGASLKIARSEIVPCAGVISYFLLDRATVPILLWPSEVL